MCGIIPWVAPWTTQWKKGAEQQHEFQLLNSKCVPRLPAPTALVKVQTWGSIEHGSILKEGDKIRRDV